MAYIGDPRSAASGSISAITGSIVGVVALYPNNERVGMSFFNDTNQSVYIAYSHSASITTRFTAKLTTQTLFEPVEKYHGVVTAVWQTVPTTGSLLVTEIV